MSLAHTYEQQTVDRRLRKRSTTNGNNRQRVRKKIKNPSDDTCNDGALQANTIAQLSGKSTPEKELRCDICKISFRSRGQARYHRNTRHSDRMLTCPHCSKKLHRRYTFDLHLPVCANRKITCELCGKKFQTLSGLKRHEVNLHNLEGPDGKVDTTELSEEGNLSSNVEIPAGESWSLKCPHCDKSYSEFKFLCRHIKQGHVPCTCDICGVDLGNAVKLRYHKLKKHTEPKHKCPNCLLTFIKRSRYEVHLVGCNSKKHSCDLCNRKFKNLTSVVIHRKQFHEDNHPSKMVNNCQAIDDEAHLKQTGSIVLKKETTEESVATNNSGFKDPQQMVSCQRTFSSTVEQVHHKIVDSLTPQPENIDIKMEIQIENTALQEQEYHHVPYDDDNQSCVTRFKVEQNDAYEHEESVIGAKIKEENSEEEGHKAKYTPNVPPGCNQTYDSPQPILVWYTS